LDITNKQVKDVVGIKSHMAVLESDQADMVRVKYPAKPKMTKPWDADNNPFSLDMLRLKKKHEGFRCRFVTKDNFQKHLDQGWIFANIKDYGGVTDRLPGEEGQADTLLRRRELTLMELPEELGKKRDEYITHKTNTRAKQNLEAAQAAVDKISHQLGEKIPFEQELDSEKGTSQRQVVET